ncbi:hypothetical protein LPJ66_000598 [Kickxella alabastrina]|uniref:Uncharacterized protein n=1 Tax=Kickxella alabastrina TaxID=61397 RepID=A0ACC1IVW9_9FUNG|nr:hypothetical protein LPJ66_000598 [Kickxella alabastrina]
MRLTSAIAIFALAFTAASSPIPGAAVLGGVVDAVAPITAAVGGIVNEKTGFDKQADVRAQAPVRDFSNVTKQRDAPFSGGSSSGGSSSGGSSSGGSSSGGSSSGGSSSGGSSSGGSSSGGSSSGGKPAPVLGGVVDLIAPITAAVGEIVNEKTGFDKQADVRAQAPVRDFSNVTKQRDAPSN